MAFIIENAGGMAIDTKLNSILDQEVVELHQRVTIAIGSSDMVEEMKTFVERYSAVSV